MNKKVTAALKNGIEPMICVGELLDEREKGLTKEVLTRQVDEGPGGVSADQMKKVVIAYEPVWAIGTGKVATPEIADEAHRFIRQVVEGLYGATGCGGPPGPVRRLGEAGQYRGPLGEGEHRRGPGGRREPEG